ncbi:hypothetical protein ACWGI0_22300 [Streptomyces sp. NPDC054802]
MTQAIGDCRTKPVAPRHPRPADRQTEEVMAILIRRSTKDTGTVTGEALRLDRFVTPAAAAVRLLHGGLL